MNRRPMQCLAALTLSLLAVGFAFQFFSVAWAQDSASSKIQSADAAVSQAFEAALLAENSGANVSGLLVSLSGAAGLVSEAKVAFSAGLEDQASAKAENALAIAVGVQSSAVGLKSDAVAAGNQAFLVGVAVFVVGSIAIVLVLILVWHRFSHHYMKRFLELKPEVVSQ
jgi:hypothetical protein